MLDIKAIRQDPTAIVSGLKKRGHEFPLDRFLSLDAQRKEADVKSQSLLAERKAQRPTSSLTQRHYDRVAAAAGGV